ERGGEAQRLRVVARRAREVARSGERRGARFGLRKARLRERIVVGRRRARAARGEREEARGQDGETPGQHAHQRARPLPCASKLSIGSMPSELSLKESLSGQMRLAAVSTSPASRAAVSP